MRVDFLGLEAFLSIAAALAVSMSRPFKKPELKIAPPLLQRAAWRQKS